MVSTASGKAASRIAGLGLEKADRGARIHERAAHRMGAPEIRAQEAEVNRRLESSRGGVWDGTGARSEGLEIDQHDDEDQKQPRHLADHAQLFLGQRPLAPRHLLCLGDEPAMIAGHGEHQRQLGVEPA